MKQSGKNSRSKLWVENQVLEDVFGENSTGVVSNKSVEEQRI